MQVTEGFLVGTGLKFGIVVSRFNGFLTEQLLNGALDALRRHAVDDDDVTVVRVPGTFEIPAVTRKLVATGNYDAVVALGAVIRGETPHFDYVAGEAAKGLGQIALESDVAVGFGIVTADTLEQAIARAGTKQGNKGADAALAALELANLYRELEPSRAKRK
jgi:6,7-dimethyl-8-ribityllumazine synthase